MNLRLFGALGAIAAITLALGSCKSDPLSDLGPKPASLVLDFNHLQLIVGGASGHLTASVLDARATPTETPVTFTACDNNVTAVIDTGYHPVPRTSARAVITSTLPAPSCVVVKGGGFTDTVTVTGLPGAFTGHLSSATPKGGDTLTIASTAQLKFDTATVTVKLGTAVAPVVSKSRDTVKVLMPFGAPAPLTIGGVLVTSYTPALAVTLPTSQSVSQTGDFWAPGDTGYATAPTFPLPTATGQSVAFLVPVPSVSNDPDCAEGTAAAGLGKCTFFTYTANGTDSLTFTTNWTPKTTATDVSDIDTYSCGAAGVSACFEDGGAGATAKTPESFSFTPAAGVHYFVIEQYSSGEDANIYVTITKKN